MTNDKKTEKEGKKARSCDQDTVSKILMTERQREEEREEKNERRNKGSLRKG